MTARIAAKANYHHPVLESPENRLQNAINENRAEDVLSILKTPDSVSRPLPNGELPFHYAIRLGKFELVEKMLKEIKLPFDKKDTQGLTPSDHALIGQNPKMIALVLGHQIGQGFDAAFCKTLNRVQEVQVERLMQDVEWFRSEKVLHRVPKLHEAAAKGNLEEVKKLLDPKDPNVYDAHGMTPLHHAVLAGKQEVVTWLLQQGGAKADILTKSNRSLLHLASIGGSTDLIPYLVETLKMDPNKTDEKGWRPLHYAMALEDLSAAKALIQKGANPILASAPPTSFIMDPTVTPLDTLLASTQKRSATRDPLALSKLEFYSFATIVVSWVNQFYGGENLDVFALVLTYFLAAQNCETRKSRLAFLFSTLVLPTLGSYHHQGGFPTNDAEVLLSVSGINQQGDSPSRLLLGLDAFNSAASCGLVTKGAFKSLAAAWKNRTYETFRPLRNAVISTVIGAFSAKTAINSINLIYDQHLMYNAWDEFMNVERESFQKASINGKAGLIQTFVLKYANNGGGSGSTPPPTQSNCDLPPNIDSLNSHERILALNPKCDTQAEKILNDCKDLDDCGKQFRVLSNKYHPTHCTADYCTPTYIKISEAYEKMKEYHKGSQGPSPSSGPCQLPLDLPAGGYERILALDLKCANQARLALENCRTEAACKKIHDDLVGVYSSDECEGPCAATVEALDAAYDKLYPRNN